MGFLHLDSFTFTGVLSAPVGVTDAHCRDQLQHIGVFSPLSPKASPLSEQHSCSVFIQNTGSLNDLHNLLALNYDPFNMTKFSLK